MKNLRKKIKDFEAASLPLRAKQKQKCINILFYYFKTEKEK